MREREGEVDMHTCVPHTFLFYVAFCVRACVCVYIYVSPSGKCCMFKLAKHSSMLKLWITGHECGIFGQMKSWKTLALNAPAEQIEIYNKFLYTFVCTCVCACIWECVGMCLFMHLVKILPSLDKGPSMQIILPIFLL